MVTRGELVVAAVRAQTLHDTLALAVKRAREARNPERKWRRCAGDVVWAAQRLASTCDRATGVRDRHYDPATV